MAVAEQSQQTDEELYHALNAMTPGELFVWAKETHGNRAGIVTSFQDTGCVMIDMMSRVAPGIRVLTIDTLRLHDETYDLIRRVEGQYGLNVERFAPDPVRLQKMIEQHGEFLFFDSKAKQEHCCNIRKVEPNDRATATLDVWFTGLRRDHSAMRSDTPKVQRIRNNGRDVLKIAPLVDWDKADVDAYVAEHNVPENELYGKGYTSIGCVICTTPTLPREPKRAGRWRWFNGLEGNDQECGIHTSGSGI